MITTIAMKCGRDEDRSNSWMIFTSTKYCQMTKKEALHSLAEYFLLKYNGNAYHFNDLEECCTASKKKDKTIKFCPRCGTGVESEELDVDAFQEWLSTDIAHGQEDSFGLTDEVENPRGWNHTENPFKKGFSIAETLIIHHDAEKMIAQAVLDQYEELKPDYDWLEEHEMNEYKELIK